MIIIRSASITTMNRLTLFCGVLRRTTRRARPRRARGTTSSSSRSIENDVDWAELLPFLCQKSNVIISSTCSVQFINYVIYNAWDSHPTADSDRFLILFKVQRLFNNRRGVDVLQVQFTLLGLCCVALAEPYFINTVDIG